MVQDAAAYQALLDRVEAIEGIQQGLADVKAGGTKPARQVFNRLRHAAGCETTTAEELSGDSPHFLE